MTLPDESPTEIASSRPRYSGRRVVLGVLFLIPLILVPLLLSGKLHETQVCIETLECREATYWVIGSYRIGALNWKPLPGWPEPITHVGFLKEIGAPSVSDPSEYPWPPVPEKHWETLTRSMPLAFVMSIDNRKALRPGRRELVELRLLEAAVLDASDADCVNRLEATLRSQDVLPEASAHRRKRPPTQAEATAEAMILSAQQAFEEGDGRQGVRVVLCTQSGPTTMSPQSLEKE